MARTCHLIFCSSPGTVDPGGSLLSDRGKPKVLSLASGFKFPKPCSAKAGVACMYGGDFCNKGDIERLCS